MCIFMAKTNKIMKIKYRAILIRFAKAFLSGAVSTATIITVTNVGTWSELAIALQALSLSAIVGGINGLLMAAEKWVRWGWVGPLSWCPPRQHE